MNTRLVHALGASLIISPLTAIAVTDTWDGNSPNAGAGDSNVSTGLNWADDTAPVSDLINTDLIFGGTTKLTPNFSGAFSTDSVTFNNTAGAFTPGGSTLTIGATGIVNSDTQIQTFTNQITLGTATTTFNAASGPLSFGTVALGTNTLSFAATTASSSSVATVTGTGTLNKTGPGTLTFGAAGAVTQNWGLNMTAGSFTVNAATDLTVSSTGSITSTSFAGLNLNGNLTMSGTTLSLFNTDVAIAAGKQLIVSSGGRLIEGSDVRFTGPGGVVITGAGSAMQHSTGSLYNFSDGASLSILVGASATAVGATFGTGGAGGNLLVDGTGASYTISPTTGTLTIGRNSAHGAVTISNGATASLAQIDLAATTNASTGQINVLSGSQVTASRLNMADGAVASIGTLTVSGTGSSLTVNGAGTLNLGAASVSNATLNVQDSGTFNTGTGTSTINATGAVSIAGGIFNANGNLTLNGGDLTCDATGVFNLGAGRTLTVQGGGDVIINAIFTNSTASTIQVTGSGSAFTATSSLSLGGGSTTNILAGGRLFTMFEPLSIGTSGNGTVTVDANGSTLVAGPLTVGQNGATGTLTIQGGATATASSLAISSLAAPASSGTVTVTGAGSALTVTGSTATIGSSGFGTGTLNVLTGGTFNSGTGTTTVNVNGTIAINAGTFNSRGTLTLNGGQLTGNGPAALSLAPGTQMTVQNGGEAAITGDFQQLALSNLFVTGSGSAFTTSGNFQWEGGNNTLALLGVSNGGRINSSNAIHLGRNNTAVSLTVSGAGSQVSASPFSTSEWQAGVTLTTGATANLGGLKLADVAFGTDSSGSLRVQSGATASIGNIAAATTFADATAAITVNGTGSAVTQTGASTLTLGSAFLGEATLSVNNGGTFTSGTGDVTLNATGTINIGGGTVTLPGPLVRNGGTVNFTSGALNIIDNWSVGSGALLGTNVTFDATRRLSTSATTTVDAFNTLTLNGGILNTGALVNNGTLVFNSGTLGITGAGGITIGTGALGANVTLGTGATLHVAQTTTINAGALLRLNGGVFTSTNVTNNGTLDVQNGAMSLTGTLNNAAGSRLFVGGLSFDSGSITNAGRITLQNGIGEISGAGLVQNTGLVTGDGTIGKAVTNSAGGQFRAEAGKTLFFTGAVAANAGTFSLEGGTLEFSNAVTNGATGFISGRGTLRTDGLTHQGVMAFSGGNTDLHGDVTSASGSRIVTSGAGAVTTFFDDVVHNGQEIFTGANASTVFFGSQSGAGPLTGTGTVYFIGDLRPGNSPGAVSISPQAIFAPSNTLAVEVGGITPGTQHDRITFTSTATPQVAWAGTLTVTLINGFTPAAGNAFDVFDFDAARDAGTFDTLTLPALTAGLAWDSSELYTTGTLRVVSTSGITFAQWATASGIPGALPGGDHDSDGYDNAQEFALGLFPPQPGTVLPTGGFRTYIEGQRLRLLFTRPLDRTGVTLTVQASTDLLTWEDLATSVNSAPFTGPGFVSENRAHPLSEPGLVEVRDILNTSTTPRRQMRLLITLAP